MRRFARTRGKKRKRAAGVMAQAARMRRGRGFGNARYVGVRYAVPFLLGLILILLCVAALPYVVEHLQATAILKLVSQEPVPWIVGRAVAEPITTEEVRFPTAAGDVRGRLYLPVNRPKAPAIVILHGIHHLGMDEPRLESFAAAMASCGLRVLTPELPNIKDYLVDADSIRVIGESTQWFAKKTGGPVGVMGLSFSGGLALLAAADPVYKPAFKFIFAVGAQDAVKHVTQSYLTGSEARPDGSVESLTPHAYGALVMEYEHVGDFVPGDDVEPLRVVLRAHLDEDKVAEDAALLQLTSQQWQEAKQLIDTNSPAALDLLARLNARHITEMEGLSPAGKLKTMTTPVYLLHGEGDTMIPAAETLWMAHELPSATRKAVLVSPVLSHLDLDAPRPRLWDECRLVHFFAGVMHAAESRT